VLLAGCSAVGTETLKNLILPGIGEFTTLDSAAITALDVSSNFFVEPSHVGSSRAQTVCELLQDLNPDTKGHFDTRNIDEIIGSERDYFRRFGLIVAANLPDSTLIPLSKICDEFHIPLIITESVGFIGTVRVQYKNIEIIEGKNSNERWNLCLGLNKPFPALESYLERTSRDISENRIDKKDISDLSYLTILHLAVKQWRASHDNKYPETDKEKDDFKKSIRMIYNSLPEPPPPPPGFPSHDSSAIPDVFNDAISNAHYPFKPYNYHFDDLRYSSEGIFGSEAGDRPERITKFTILNESFRRFIQRFDRLPVVSRLPDLSCASSTYKEIAAIYREQSSSDKAIFREIFAEIYAAWGVDPREFEIGLEKIEFDEPKEAFEYDLLDIYFKNLFHLKFVSTTPYHVEAETEAINDLENVVMSDLWSWVSPIPDDVGNFSKLNTTPLSWYVALRAARRFQTTNGRNVAATAEDTEEIWRLIQRDLMLDSGENENRGTILEFFSRDIAEEICNFEGKETIHAVSSFIGGTASQEAIKLIAQVFEPLNNLVVYNGVVGNASRYTMTK